MHTYKQLSEDPLNYYGQIDWYTNERTEGTIIVISSLTLRNKDQMLPLFLHQCSHRWHADYFNLQIRFHYKFQFFLRECSQTSRQIFDMWLFSHRLACLFFKKFQKIRTSPCPTVESTSFKNTSGINECSKGSQMRQPWRDFEMTPFTNCFVFRHYCEYISKFILSHSSWVCFLLPFTEHRHTP